MQIRKLFLAGVIGAVISGAVGGIFGAFSVLTTDHFVLTNTVERVSAQEKGKLDVSIYHADQRREDERYAGILTSLKEIKELIKEKHQ